MTISFLCIIFQFPLKFHFCLPVMTFLPSNSDNFACRQKCHLIFFASRIVLFMANFDCQFGIGSISGKFQVWQKACEGQSLDFGFDIYSSIFETFFQNYCQPLCNMKPQGLLTYFQSTNECSSFCLTTLSLKGRFCLDLKALYRTPLGTSRQHWYREQNGEFDCFTPIYYKMTL